MHPKQEELKAIYDWYKDTFSFDDGGSIDLYFKEQMCIENCYIKRNDAGEIVSMLCAHPHTMHLLGRTFPLLMINGVITREDARRQGWMKRLFEDVFQEYASTPFYALQAYEPTRYHSLGFHETTFVKWEIVTAVPHTDHLQELQNPNDLADCAMHWLSQYDGWCDHDVTFYNNQIKEAAHMKQLILGFYEAQQLQAFARCRREHDTIWIEEYCARSYEKEKQLFQMLQSRFLHIMVAKPCTRMSAHSECTLMIRTNPNTMKDKNILDRLYCQNKDVIKPLYHYGWW